MGFEEKVRTYFSDFSQRFFYSKLTDVKIECSGRLKKSAGMFYSPRKEETSCRIGLNRKLLTMRSDKEIKETLLHEMIHAFLFITTRGKGIKLLPHGKEFKLKAQEINKALSINITTRHDYNNWYRCDGMCRELKSCFFGYVSRISSQCPDSLNDYSTHKKVCGGMLQRVDKPDKTVIQIIKEQRKTTAKKRKPKTRSDYPSNFLDLSKIPSRHAMSVDYDTDETSDD